MDQTFTYTAIQDDSVAKPSSPVVKPGQPNVMRGFWLVVAVSDGGLEIDSWWHGKRAAAKRAITQSAKHIEVTYLVMRPQARYSAIVNVQKWRFW